MKSKYLIVAGVVAGVIFGTAIAAYASTHTLQFVETPIVQLYEAESSAATSIVVTPVPIDLDGNVLTMSSFGSSPTLTVDPGISGYEEIEGFTSITNNGNGTATIGGLTRDLASQYPYTTSGTGKAHAAGSTVVFSNNPQMYARFAAPENTQTWTATQTFSSTTPPAYDFNPNFNLVSSTTFASVGYVASTSYNGTVNGTTAAKGIFQQATALQAASSTAVGSTGANLVLGSNIATDTPSTSGCATSSGGCVVMSLLNGKISQLWLDLTQAFTVTGLWTFNSGFIDNASSTIAANASNKLTLNALSYIFPSARGASSSALEENGSGGLTFQPIPTNPVYQLFLDPTYHSIGTAAQGTSTTLTATIPPNTLTASSSLRISVVLHSTQSVTCVMISDLEIGNGSASTTIAFNSVGEPYTKAYQFWVTLPSAGNELISDIVTPASYTTSYSATSNLYLASTASITGSSANCTAGVEGLEVDVF